MALSKKEEQKIAEVAQKRPDRIAAAFSRLHDAYPRTVERVLEDEVSTLLRAISIGEMLNQAAKTSKTPAELDKNITDFIFRTTQGMEPTEENPKGEEDGS